MHNGFKPSRDFFIKSELVTPALMLILSQTAKKNAIFEDVLCLRIQKDSFWKHLLGKISHCQFSNPFKLTKTHLGRWFHCSTPLSIVVRKSIYFDLKALKSSKLLNFEFFFSVFYIILILFSLSFFVYFFLPLIFLSSFSHLSLFFLCYLILFGNILYFLTWNDLNNYVL